MIRKVRNINPITTFMTINGNRTPKEIWECEDTGIRDITKKGVETHKERLREIGITINMTDEEAIEQAKIFINGLHGTGE